MTRLIATKIVDHLMSGKTGTRLEGLDLARFLAFFGMVIVNFKIAMGADGGDGPVASFMALFEGRAAATFVVLAGVGLGLSGGSQLGKTTWVTLKRAAFLLVIGLINMTIFTADILHYYAFYFLFGALLLPVRTRALILLILALNLAFVAMVLVLDYDAGWNWETYDYRDFWTPVGFVRNLFFNGWHPVIPWLGFLLFGVVLSRLALSRTRTQIWLVAGGGLALLAAGAGRLVLEQALGAVDPELAVFATTAPIPPMPLYTLAGMGTASLVVGICLLLEAPLKRLGVLGLFTPAGRQTLTLYLAHILIGMGTLEAMGRLGGQTPAQALNAAVIFCAAAVVFSWIWARFFKRGPLEALMRWVTG